MAIVVSGVIGAADRVAVASGGPAGLADDDVHVGESDGFHGGVDGVHVGDEHVGVGDAGELVVEAGVGAEEGEIQLFWRRHSEVWIRIHHERRLGLA